MQQPDSNFDLPMVLTFLESSNGNHVAHSLDFDLVAVADSEEEAWMKLRIAVKTYVEFGLSNDWKEYIKFSAPQQFWDKITPDVPSRILEPIVLGAAHKKVLAIHESPDDASIPIAG
jgi:hypothetical protein